MGSLPRSAEGLCRHEPVFHRPGMLSGMSLVIPGWALAQASCPKRTVGQDPHLRRHFHDYATTTNALPRSRL